jgi:hypothetical protein
MCAKMKYTYNFNLDPSASSIVADRSVFPFNQVISLESGKTLVSPTEARIYFTILDFFKKCL